MAQPPRAFRSQPLLNLVPTCVCVAISVGPADSQLVLVAMFMLARATQGLGGALVQTVIMSILADTFPDNQGRVLGFASTAGAFAWTIGPPVWSPPSLQGVCVCGGGGALAVLSSAQSAGVQWFAAAGQVGGILFELGGFRLPFLLAGTLPPIMMALQASLKPKRALGNSMEGQKPPSAAAMWLRLNQISTFSLFIPVRRAAAATPPSPPRVCLPCSPGGSPPARLRRCAAPLLRVHLCCRQALAVLLMTAKWTNFDIGVTIWLQVCHCRCSTTTATATAAAICDGGT